MSKCIYCSTRTILQLCFDEYLNTVTHSWPTMSCESHVSKAYMWSTKVAWNTQTNLGLQCWLNTQLKLHGIIQAERMLCNWETKEEMVEANLMELECTKRAQPLWLMMVTTDLNIHKIYIKYIYLFQALNRPLQLSGHYLLLITS